ncbi:hypothetical protein M413DRAFT_449591 [Hebeloma cylindrosporum]|uniref:Uncharacterized protein n=1 Tax=Hebeloma cylindrosporum TaxID=76867 RepID=A0A0C2Y3V2_HEBCY|nr:hypothetical protein M413DRAFT_449591 [Hebeloma cylindrosporum h7]
MEPLPCEGSAYLGTTPHACLQLEYWREIALSTPSLWNISTLTTKGNTGGILTRLFHSSDIPDMHHFTFAFTYVRIGSPPTQKTSIRLSGPLPTAQKPFNSIGPGS